MANGFRYKKCADQFFRLQTERYESPELAAHLQEQEQRQQEEAKSRLLEQLARKNQLAKRAGPGGSAGDREQQLRRKPTAAAAAARHTAIMVNPLLQRSLGELASDLHGGAGALAALALHHQSAIGLPAVSCHGGGGGGGGGAEAVLSPLHIVYLNDTPTGII